jgi:hypothetical protein
MFNLNEVTGPGPSCLELAQAATDMARKAHLTGAVFSRPSLLPPTCTATESLPPHAGPHRGKSWFRVLLLSPS